MKVFASSALNGNTKLKLALTFLGLPLLFLCVTGLLILFFKLNLATTGSHFTTKKSLVNIIQIVFYPALIGIWYKPSITHLLRIKILSASILLGYMWWAFEPGSVMSTTVATITTGALLKEQELCEQFFSSKLKLILAALVVMLGAFFLNSFIVEQGNKRELARVVKEKKVASNQVHDVEERRKQYLSAFKDRLAEINKKYPQAVDEITRIDSLDLDGNKVVAKYTITAKSLLAAKWVQLDKLRAELQKDLSTKFCSDSMYATQRELGIFIKNKYYNSNKEFIFETNTGFDDCLPDQDKL